MKNELYKNQIERESIALFKKNFLKESHNWFKHTDFSKKIVKADKEKTYESKNLVTGRLQFGWGGIFFLLCCVVVVCDNSSWQSCNHIIDNLIYSAEALTLVYMILFIIYILPLFIFHECLGLVSQGHCIKSCRIICSNLGILYILSIFGSIIYCSIKICNLSLEIYQLILRLKNNDKISNYDVTRILIDLSTDDKTCSDMPGYLYIESMKHCVFFNESIFTNFYENIWFIGNKNNYIYLIIIATIICVVCYIIVYYENFRVFKLFIFIIMINWISTKTLVIINIFFLKTSRNLRLSEEIVRIIKDIGFIKLTMFIYSTVIRSSSIFILSTFASYFHTDTNILKISIYVLTFYVINVYLYFKNEEYEQYFYREKLSAYTSFNFIKCNSYINLFQDIINSKLYLADDKYSVWKKLCLFFSSYSYLLTCLFAIFMQLIAPISIFNELKKVDCGYELIKKVYSYKSLIKKYQKENDENLSDTSLNTFKNKYLNTNNKKRSWINIFKKVQKGVNISKYKKEKNKNNSPESSEHSNSSIYKKLEKNSRKKPDEYLSYKTNNQANNSDDSQFLKKGVLENMKSNVLKINASTKENKSDINNNDNFMSFEKKNKKSYEKSLSSNVSKYLKKSNSQTSYKNFLSADTVSEKRYSLKNYISINASSEDVNMYKNYDDYINFYNKTYSKHVEEFKKFEMDKRSKDLTYHYSHNSYKNSSIMDYADRMNTFTNPNKKKYKHFSSNISFMDNISKIFFQIIKNYGKIILMFIINIFVILHILDFTRNYNLVTEIILNSLYRTFLIFIISVQIIYSCWFFAMYYQMSQCGTVSCLVHLITWTVALPIFTVFFNKIFFYILIIMLNIISIIIAYIEVHNKLKNKNVLNKKNNINIQNNVDTKAYNSSTILEIKTKKNSRQFNNLTNKIFIFKKSIFWLYFGNIDILRKNINIAISGNEDKYIPFIWNILFKYVASPILSIVIYKSLKLYFIDFIDRVTFTFSVCIELASIIIVIIISIGFVFFSFTSDFQSDTIIIPNVPIKSSKKQKNIFID